MLQKFKITTCAFILCLFGLTLMTVSPVFAADSAAFVECQDMKWKKGKKAKKNCFRDGWSALLETQTTTGSDEPTRLYGRVFAYPVNAELCTIVSSIKDSVGHLQGDRGRTSANEEDPRLLLIELQCNVCGADWAVCSTFKQ